LKNIPWVENRGNRLRGTKQKKIEKKVKRLLAAENEKREKKENK
jgi:hypothetical protein